MSADSLKEKKIKIGSLPRKQSQEFVSTYANNVGSAMTGFDLRLLFGQVIVSPSETPFIEDRVSITMTWEQVLPLRDHLSKLIEKYESTHGTIRCLDGPGPKNELT